jgi:hypothetical protein
VGAEAVFVVFGMVLRFPITKQEARLPISLSSAEHAAIERAARPLDPDRRQPFATAVLAALESVPELGSGVVPARSDRCSANSGNPR